VLGHTGGGDLMLTVPAGSHCLVLDGSISGGDGIVGYASLG
jgi:hypothetical protein